MCFSIAERIWSRSKVTLSAKYVKVHFVLPGVVEAKNMLCQLQRCCAAKNGCCMFRRCCGEQHKSSRSHRPRSAETAVAIAASLGCVPILVMKCGSCNSRHRLISWLPGVIPLELTSCSHRCLDVSRVVAVRSQFQLWERHRSKGSTKHSPGIKLLPFHRW